MNSASSFIAPALAGCDAAWTMPRVLWIGRGCCTFLGAWMFGMVCAKSTCASTLAGLSSPASSPWWVFATELPSPALAVRGGGAGAIVNGTSSSAISVSMAYTRRWPTSMKVALDSTPTATTQKETPGHDPVMVDDTAGLGGLTGGFDFGMGEPLGTDKGRGSRGFRGGSTFEADGHCRNLPLLCVCDRHRRWIAALLGVFSAHSVHPFLLLAIIWLFMRHSKAMLKSAPVMHRHQCALCEARDQWLFRCEAPSCNLLVCAECIGDIPGRPGVQRCVRCLRQGEVLARCVKDDFAPNGCRYETLAQIEGPEHPNMQYRIPLVTAPWLAYKKELVADEIGSCYATLAKLKETSIVGGIDANPESEQIMGDGEGSAAADDNDTDDGDYVMLGTYESEQDRGPTAGNAAS